jgi:hypothetical protein
MTDNVDRYIPCRICRIFADFAQLWKGKYCRGAEYRLPGRVQAVPADPSICLPSGSLFTHLSVGAVRRSSRENRGGNIEENETEGVGRYSGSGGV